jgi:hypothetical protein
MLKEIKMETKNIFIDTQAFIQQGLRFENATLEKLKDLGSSGCINILISEVVKREVEYKLEEKFRLMSEKMNALKKDIVSLQLNIPENVENSFNQIHYFITTQLSSRWNNFLTECKSLILDSINVNPNELISMYFNGLSPFSDGKKKSEFPDAVSLLAIREWANSNDQKVYVVTQDRDFNGFCKASKNLILLPSLAEFLDLFNRAEVRLGEEIHTIISAKEKTIIEYIHEQFLECSFSCSGIDDPDVGSVKVSEVDFDQVDIISIENGKVIVSVQASIFGSALIVGYDYTNGIWDREEKQYIHLEQYCADLDFTENYEVTFSINFNLSTMEIVDFQEFLFNGCSEICLDFYDDGFPYK